MDLGDQVLVAAMGPSGIRARVGGSLQVMEQTGVDHHFEACRDPDLCYFGDVSLPGHGGTSV